MKIHELSESQMRYLHNKRECNFSVWSDKFNVPICRNPDLKSIDSNQAYFCVGVRYDNTGRFPFFCPIEPGQSDSIGIMLKELKEQ